LLSPPWGLVAPSPLCTSNPHVWVPDFDLDIWAYNWLLRNIFICAQDRGLIVHFEKYWDQLQIFLFYSFLGVWALPEEVNHSEGVDRIGLA
jgi:hypothetical protein